MTCSDSCRRALPGPCACQCHGAHHGEHAPVRQLTLVVGSESAGGVEGHARPHSDGTGCGDPAQGLLVREQQTPPRQYGLDPADTLVAPTQAGIEPGPALSLSMNGQHASVRQLVLVVGSESEPEADDEISAAVGISGPVTQPNDAQDCGSLSLPASEAVRRAGATTDGGQVPPVNPVVEGAAATTASTTAVRSPHSLEVRGVTVRVVPAWRHVGDQVTPIWQARAGGSKASGDTPEDAAGKAVRS